MQRLSIRGFVITSSVPGLKALHVPPQLVLCQAYDPGPCCIVAHNMRCLDALVLRVIKTVGRSKRGAWKWSAVFCACYSWQKNDKAVLTVKTGSLCSERNSWVSNFWWRSRHFNLAQRTSPLAIKLIPSRLRHLRSRRSSRPVKIKSFTMYQIPPYTQVSLLVKN